MKCNNAKCLIMLSVLVIIFIGDDVNGMPPAQCSPGLIEEVPPRIRKVCAALSTIYEIGSAMENYINDKVPVMRDGVPLMDNAVKRQDSDHVFLRFGRKR